MERDRIRRAYTRRIILVILCLMVLVSNGCAEKFEAFKAPPISIAAPDNYDIQADLNKIPKPSKIKRMYAKILNDGRLQFVDDSTKADVFVLVPEEYAKINMLKELAITYKKIIIEQEELVNTKNHTIAELLRLIKIIEAERDIAITGWENSENMYRQEKRSHQIDNAINKSGMYLISIGSIILLAIGL